MVKGEDGAWEVTTKPLLPGFHYYLISVDEFVSTDPGSRTFFAARKEVSGIEVPAPESDSLRSRMCRTAPSVRNGTFRRPPETGGGFLCIHLEATTKTLTAIRCYTSNMDGARTRWGEDESAWSHQGHENFTLDNLIAANKAKPMIIVNENGIAFSSALFVTDTAKDGALADPARLNQQRRLLWIGIGSDDFLLTGIKASHEALEKTGIKHVGREFRRACLDRVAEVPGGFCPKTLSVSIRFEN